MANSDSPDLSRLWEEHTRHEFATGDTEATLETMVEDAYVNHIPVLTGGYGKAELREFYSSRFIPTMPPEQEERPEALAFSTVPTRSLYVCVEQIEE